MSDPLHVLVCGGRDYQDGVTLTKHLDALMWEYGIAVIIQGGAKGADQLAFKWAERRRVPCLTVWADWSSYGKQAGFIRNAKMLEWNPDLVVAFPGGKGTNMMVRIARNSEVPVEDYR